MAKELPYFKFEPNEWENGRIQICSRESKGLFIDLCSIYWSRLGELPYALALQKHCNGNAKALQELEDNDIIGVSDGQIIIEFLDEQLNEFQETSEKRRNAANKRWSNASALQVQSKSNAIREEEKREEKIRKRFVPPTLLEVKEYFKEKGYTESSAIKAFEYYESNSWKDSQGNKVKSWKQKMIGVWFKDENKSFESNVSKPKFAINR
jgi:hypothetical protein